MIRHQHQRDSSISTLGSGDWGSEVGAVYEELSTGDYSTAASDHSNRVRAVAEMAILASTSPEIKALSLRRGNSFPQAYCTSILSQSPGSSVASSTLSRTNLSVASFFGDADKSNEEMKQQEDLDFTLAKAKSHTTDKLATLNFENLRIEPPPMTKREQVADLASLIGKEDIPPNIRCYSAPTSETSSQGSAQKLRKSLFTGRSNIRDSFIGSGSSSKRPPMPLKSSKRRTMHRRGSFDSLPSPSEISLSTPSPLDKAASERALSSNQSDRSMHSLSSERGHRARSLRATSKRVSPCNLSKKFYC